jgi:WD40 repeat protein
MYILRDLAIQHYGRVLLIFMFLSTFLLMSAHVNATDRIPITTATLQYLHPLATSFFFDGLSQIETVTFLPNSQSLLASTSNISLIWDMASMGINGFGYRPALDASPDGQHILISRSDFGTRLIEPGRDEAIHLFSGTINGGVFSPDSRWVVTVEVQNSQYQLWDTQTGQEIALLDNRDTTMPIFTPDSRELVLFKRDGSIALWTIESRSVRLVLPTTAGKAFITPDGHQLVTYAGNGFDFWQLENGEHLTTNRFLETRQEQGIALLSPDSKTLLHWNIDDPGGKPTLWDVRDLTQVREIGSFSIPPIPFAEQYQFTFSKDSRFLSLFNHIGDGTLYVIDAQTATLALTLKASTETLNGAALSADNNLIFTSSNDDRTRIWQWENEVVTEVTNLPGSQMLLSADETTLVTVAGDKTLIVYGIPTAERPAQRLYISGRIVPSVVNVRFEPRPDASLIGTASGEVIFSGRSGDYLLLDNSGWVLGGPSYVELDANFPVEWLPEGGDITQVGLIPELPAPPTSTLAPPTPIFTPGPAPTLALTSTAVSTGTLDLPPITGANAAEIGLQAVLPGSMASQSSSTRLVTAPSYEQPLHIWNLVDFSVEPVPDMYRFVASSPDGAFIAYEGLDGNLHVWDVNRETDMAISPIRDDIAFNTALFTPDGSALIYWTYAQTYHVWDITTGRERFSFPGSYLQWAVSADSQTLVTIPTSGGILRGYNLLTGDVSSQYDIGNRAVSDLVLSPDGAQVVLVSPDQLRVWGLDGTERSQLHGSFKEIRFSPDSNLLATLSSENLLELRDPYTLEVRGRTDALDTQSLAFSPDTSLIALTDPLRLWILNTGEIVTIDGGYSAQRTVFSTDGITLLADVGYSTMVFGIPTPQRPAWEPLTGRIIPSGVNLRSAPSIDSEIIGYAQGEVIISGRRGNAVYLPELGGWVWSDPDFLDMGEKRLEELPLLSIPDFDEEF